MVVLVLVSSSDFELGGCGACVHGCAFVFISFGLGRGGGGGVRADVFSHVFLFSAFSGKLRQYLVNYTGHEPFYFCAYTFLLISS